jgi:uncharacterized membrane protein
MVLGSTSDLGGSAGGIIFIGPIPIILGSGPYSVPLIVLAAILTIAGFIFLLFMMKRSYREIGG